MATEMNSANRKTSVRDNNGGSRATMEDRKGLVVMSISGIWMYAYMIVLPTFALTACVVISLVFNFRGSVATACRVANYLPSISAAIGGYTPQRYIWRICIALHIAPRFLVSLLYYNYYCSFAASIRGVLKLVALLAGFMHFLENMSLVTLSYVSSTENYSVHEGSFYLFIVFSQIYMVLTCVLFKLAHKNHWTSKSKRSYKYKIRIWLFNVASLIAAGYFFFRHNTYCEPGMYTIFAACEYSVILSNIAFHGSALLEFGHGSLTFTNAEEERKSE